MDGEDLDCRRNRAGMPAVTSGSDVKLCRPGGVSGEGKRGKRRGARGLFKGVVEASNYAGSKRN
jgi:hypothetical protein